jgi:hypothetical protein
VISSVLKPNSPRTSSVCSPNSGGRAAILLGVRDNVNGCPTSLIRRRRGRVPVEWSGWFHYYPGVSPVIDQVFSRVEQILQPARA